MKYLLIIVALAFGACAHTAKVTPMPDVAPVRESNKNTIREIHHTKTKIDEARQSNDKGANALKDAESILVRLLK